MLKRSFVFIRPNPAVRPWVDGYYVETVSSGALSARPYHIRPDDAAYLIVRRTIHQASPNKVTTDRVPRLVGPRSVHKPTDLTGRAMTILVRFQPGAVTSLFGPGPSDVLDAAYPLQDVAPLPAARLVETLSDDRSPEELVEAIQHEIALHARSASPPDPLVSSVLQRSRVSAGRLSVAELSRLAGLSSRQLRNRFLESTGLSPKLVTRIHRLEFTLRLPEIQPDITPAGLAFAAGYSDQPHLSREFRSLLGVSPAKWLYG